MKRVIKWMFAILSFGVLLGAVLVVVLPNPARMLAPTLFGFEEIGPGVFVSPEMTKAQRANLLAKVEAGYDRVERFYGEPVVRTTIVLCLGETCDGVFGKQRFAGYAYGTLVVRVNERGFNMPLIAHELAHVAYAERLGNLRILRGRDPHWFNEGLAVVVGQDLDDTLFVTEAAKAALSAAPHWSDWGQHVSAFGRKRAYAGAAQRVRAVDTRLGGGMLPKLVATMGQGHSFEQSIAQLSK